jgi:kynureninase
LKKAHNPAGAAARNSLEIPGSTEASPIVDGHVGSSLQSITNGSGEHTATYSDGTEGEMGMGWTGHATTARMAQARRATPGVGRQSLGKSEVVEHRPVGVSLTDRPMDD